ncbi:acyl carrier protein [Streptomyces sp. NBC_01565]|uniref:acyl carrier protein n=1 Tax=unclassified Streptomyces TaxID=2593676 RepID=UPI00224FCA19|nr:acyl carrier protein [Streptomyces sp. NBC_01565]MCX4546374.1 acyl carrier protein [Streptomyces sp. NBC_01565]
MSESVRQPLDYIRTYLASAFDMDMDELTGDRTFDSLELDSIAQVEMFVTLSDHYGIHLDDSLAKGEMTLRQTAELVAAAREGVARQRQGTHTTAPS